MKELSDLLKLLLKYKRRVILGVLFLLIVDGSHMVIPWVLKFVVDDLGSLPLSRPLWFYVSIILGIGFLV
ncbi:MAG: hypothetical protein P8Z50_05715, partial [candidate division WOR-3 bacterium]